MCVELLTRWYKGSCPACLSGLPRDWSSANFWRQQRQQLRWGFHIYSLIRTNPRTSLCSDSPSSAKFFKNCHESALCRTVKHFTIGQVQTKTSELTEDSYWPITENTHFVQLLIAFRNKSAASNSTFICFLSSFFKAKYCLKCRFS